MGVPLGESIGDATTLLKCESCTGYYETDETMPNDCPECGYRPFEIVSGLAADRDEWRADPAAYHAKQ